MKLDNNHRDMRFELLRIVSIYIIILHHLILHVAINEYVGINVNLLISQLYLIGGKVGVNIFLLISGYFGIKGGFRPSKALKIELQVLFYTVLSVGIGLLFFPEIISVKIIIQAILPTTFNAYWYITAYMAMYLLSPYINMVANYISRKKYIFLLGILFFIESFAPTVLRQRYWASDLMWFIFVYLIGAYIRNYEIGKGIKTIYLYIASAVSWLVPWIISIVLYVVSLRIVALQKYVNVFSTSNYSFFVLAISVLVFLTFASMKPIYNQAIYKFSKTTLGIYLIQSNPVIASILWQYIKNLKIHFMKLWPIYALVLSAVILNVCYGIEKIRGQIVTFVLKKNKYIQIIYKKIDSIWCGEN